MGHHRSRRPTSSDSGYDTNSDRPSSPVHERAKDPVHERSSTNSHVKSPISPSEKLGFNSLLASTTRTDVTSSIGTHLDNVQLSTLSHQQLDELAHLVSERGVVFFHDQDLTAADQLRISEHYGSASSSQIVERNARFVKIKTSQHDHGENFTYASEKQEEWQADRSFEVHPPSYSMVKANGLGPDTIWVSQYGVYDALSKHMKSFIDELEAIHTSDLQYSSIANLRGTPASRSPISSHHPAVLTHPITGLKALNVTPAHVSAFSDLTANESTKLLDLLTENLNSLPEHSVRFSWTSGSVALWDNRCVAHKHVEGFSTGVFNCFETVILGGKPTFNPTSLSLEQKTTQSKTNAEEHRRMKARFNNTPLRRILNRQTTNPAVESSLSPTSSSPCPTSSEDEETATKHDDVHSVEGPTIPSTLDSQQTHNAVTKQTHTVTVEQGEEQVAEQVAEQVEETEFIDADPIVLIEKKVNEKRNETTLSVQVTFRGSPLRRIIQRQMAVQT